MHSLALFKPSTRITGGSKFLRSRIFRFAPGCDNCKMETAKTSITACGVVLRKVMFCVVVALICWPKCECAGHVRHQRVMGCLESNSRICSSGKIGFWNTLWKLRHQSSQLILWLHLLANVLLDRSFLGGATAVTRQRRWVLLIQVVSSWFYKWREHMMLKHFNRQGNWI